MLDSVRFSRMKQVTSLLRSFPAFAFFFLGFGMAIVRLPSLALPQASPREDLHGVLSRVQLTPPLRSGSFYVRFSSDGRHLLAKDSTGVFVFSADPLKFVVHIVADKLYDASFTPDSQAIRMVARDLRVATRNLENLERLDLKALPIKEGCLSVAVSPNGTRLACAQPDFSLKAFDLATAQEIYASPADKMLTENPGALLRLDTNGVYAGPIGFILVNSWAPMADRDMQIVPMLFSPNAQELIVGSPRGVGSRIDLQTQKNLNLPGSIKDRLHSSVAWLDGNRVVASEREKPHTPKIFSLENGATLSTLPFTASSFQACSNPRYLLLHDFGASGGRIFDLQENRLLDIPENIGVDVFGPIMALLIEDGELYLYHVGDKLPYRMAHLPPANLPELRVASVDSGLKIINLAVEGRGAVFSTTAGGRIGDFQRFLAAYGGEGSASFLTMPQTPLDPAKILRLDTTLRTSSAIASLGSEFLRSGGSVLLEYSFESPMGKGMMFNMAGDVPYKLRALDPQSGAVLWKRSFFRDTPVPFPDPQGTRSRWAGGLKALGRETLPDAFPPPSKSSKKPNSTNTTLFLKYSKLAAANR